MPSYRRGHHHGSRGRLIGGGGGIGPSHLPAAPGARRKRKKKKSGSVGSGRSGSRTKPLKRRERSPERRLTAPDAPTISYASSLPEKRGAVSLRSAHSYQNQMVEYANPNSGQVHDSTSKKAIDYGAGFEDQLLLDAPQIPIQQQGGFAEAEEPQAQPDYGADAAALGDATINIRNPVREPEEMIGGRAPAPVPTVAAAATAEPLGMDMPAPEAEPPFTGHLQRETEPPFTGHLQRAVVPYDDPTAEPEIEVVHRPNDSVHQNGARMLQDVEQYMEKHEIEPTAEKYDFDSTVGTTANQHSRAGDHPDADGRYNQRVANTAPQIEAPVHERSVASRIDNDVSASAGLGPLHSDSNIFGDHTMKVSRKGGGTDVVPYTALTEVEKNQLPANAKIKADFSVNQHEASGAGRAFKVGLEEAERRRKREDSRDARAAKLRLLQAQKRRGLGTKEQNAVMNGTLPGEAQQMLKFPMEMGTAQIRQEATDDPRQKTTMISAGQPARRGGRFTTPEQDKILAMGARNLADATAKAEAEAQKQRARQPAQATPQPPPPGMPGLEAAGPTSQVLAHGPGGSAVTGIGGVPTAQTGGAHALPGAAMQASQRVVAFNQHVRALMARNPGMTAATATAQLNSTYGTSYPVVQPLPSGPLAGGAVTALGGGGTAPPAGGGGPPAAVTAPAVTAPPAPTGGTGGTGGTGRQAHNVHPQQGWFDSLRLQLVGQGMTPTEARKRANEIIAARQPTGRAEETKINIKPPYVSPATTIKGEEFTPPKPVPKPPLPPPKPWPEIKKEEPKTETGSIHGYVPAKPDPPSPGPLPPRRPEMPELEARTDPTTARTETTAATTYVPPDRPETELTDVTMHSVHRDDPDDRDPTLPSIPDMPRRRVRFSEVSDVEPHSFGRPPTRPPAYPYPVAMAPGGYGVPRGILGGYGGGPGVGTGQQSGQQQAPVTVTTQGGGPGASSSSAGGGQQRAPIIVQAPKKKAAAKKKAKGTKKVQTGVTAARKKYTAKRKSKLAELRSSKAKRIREFNAKTKKLPPAERKKRRADFKKKVNAQYKNIVSKFPTARGMTSVQQLQRLIKQAESIRA